MPRRNEPSHRQLIQRRCFLNCVAWWHSLPLECPPPPHCGTTPSKEYIFDIKQGRGVMSSYYDMFMRCCMQTCNAMGVPQNPNEECFPCPPNHDPFKPDPANPETIEGGETVQLCVLGGVPPYHWEKTSGECITPDLAYGECISVSSDPVACCSGGYTVTDECGNTCHVGLRGIGGAWVLLDSTACKVTGPRTSGSGLYGELIRGRYKIFEHAKMFSNTGGGTPEPDDCPPMITGALASCAQNCDSALDCDPDLGCQLDQACIDEIRQANCQVILNCEYDGSHYKWQVRSYCLRYREVYEWKCP